VPWIVGQSTGLQSLLGLDSVSTWHTCMHGFSVELCCLQGSKLSCRPAYRTYHLHSEGQQYSMALCSLGRMPRSWRKLYRVGDVSLRTSLLW